MNIPTPDWVCQLPFDWPLVHRLPKSGQAAIVAAVEAVWRDGWFRGAVTASLAWIFLLFVFLFILNVRGSKRAR